MATGNNIGEAANKAAEAAAKAAAIIAAAAATAAAITAKAAEIKRKKEEAQRKVKEIKEKVKKLKIKKEKVDKKIALFQMPKGIGYIILSFLIRTLQQTWVAEKAIALLKKKFEEKCPLPEVLKKIIKNKNRVSGVITQIQQIIQTLQTTTQTLNTLTQALSFIVLAAEGLILSVGMISVSPPGPTTLASEGKTEAKRTRDKIITTVAQGVAGLTVINFALIKLTTLLQEIEALISVCLIEAIESGEMSEDEVNELLIDLNTKSTDSSNEEDNKLKGDDILKQGYRGFKFEVQQNPNNPLETIPQRRVIGIQVKTDILTVATDYSFSSTTEVLVNEAKFLVDQWIFNSTDFESNIVITIPEPEEEIELPLGYYWKYTDTDVYYYEFEGDVTIFNTLEEYYNHREGNHLPRDLSKIQFRGPDPEKMVSEAATASAAQARQAQINTLQSQISGWVSDITSIKSRITAGVESTGFNKKNDALWNDRVNSWTSQQWHTNRNSSAFGRINRNMNRTLLTDINNWVDLNTKITDNEAQIDAL